MSDEFFKTEADDLVANFTIALFEMAKFVTKSMSIVADAGGLEEEDIIALNQKLQTYKALYDKGVAYIDRTYPLVKP